MLLGKNNVYLQREELADEAGYFSLSCLPHGLVLQWKSNASISGNKNMLSRKMFYLFRKMVEKRKMVIKI